VAFLILTVSDDTLMLVHRHIRMWHLHIHIYGLDCHTAYMNDN